MLATHSRLDLSGLVMNSRNVAAKMDDHEGSKFRTQVHKLGGYCRVPTPRRNIAQEWGKTTGSSMNTTG
jgi:hypothetical protein